MSAEQTIEEEIIVTGSLFTITLFQQKLMRNFLLISHKLRKLQGLTQLQQRNRALEKQLKFVNMKVDTLIQKLPKQGISINRNDIKSISKDLFFQLLNSNDQKLIKSKYCTQIQTQIAKLKEQISKISTNQYSNVASLSFNRIGQNSLIGQQNAKDSQKQRKRIEATQQNLKNVLNPNQEQILNSIMTDKTQKKRILQQANNQELNTRFDKLQKMVQELRLGRGYSSFLQKQIQRFRRYEEFEQKSKLTSRKTKQKYHELQKSKKDKQDVQVSKKALYLQLQKMDLKRQSIARQQATQRSTAFKSALTKNNIQKDQISQLQNQVKQIKKINKQKNEESFRRSSSIKRLDPIQKRIKIDDLKELNSILKSLELKIQGKISHEVYLGFVKEFEEKLQVIKLSRDTSFQINQLRKNILALQSKLYSVIQYIQNITKQQDGLVVKKKWTCISCDKNIQNYEGKIGQHLNWDNVNAKKMSPLKVAGFGQTGQFATKIRNLIQNNDEE